MHEINKRNCIRLPDSNKYKLVTANTAFKVELKVKLRLIATKPKESAANK